MSTLPQRIGIIGSTPIMEAPPAAPVLTSATPAANEVTLVWQQPSTGGSPITSYSVLRSTSSGAETPLATGLSPTLLTYQDTTVANGTTYFYTVTATNAIGTSPQSNELSATPVATPVVPGAPTLNSATAGVGQVALVWTAGSNGGSAITGYKLLRGVSGGSLSLYQTFGVQTSYTDTGVTNGTSYSYAVEAVNIIGTGAQSNTRTATPNALVPGAPVLSAVAGNATATLNWTAPSTGGSPITHYQVFRGLSAGSLTLLTTLGAVLTFADSGLTNGTQYFYAVHAQNAVGSGPASNTVALTPTVPGTTGVIIAQLATTGGPPGARGQGYGAYHPGTGLIYYFGGNGPPSGAPLADTWSFNPTTKVWTHITSATAPANVSVSIGYDPVSTHLIMFGGDNESTWFNTTYSMDPTVGSPTWTQLHPTTVPGVRSGQVMFNNPASGQLMMYGGNTGTPTYYDDCWTWNGTNWVESFTAFTGTGRTGAFAASVTVTTPSEVTSVVIFGGANSAVLNDTHVFNGFGCAAASPATIPPARFFGGAATTNDGRALIYGGANRLSTVNSSDCWIWDGTNWTKETPTGVSVGGLSSQSMNYHPPTQEIISAFGSQGASANPPTDINTVYSYTVGSAPPPPPPSGAMLGLYAATQTVSNIQSLASTLGVSSNLRGYSFYTLGTTYSSISSWTVPGTVPAGGTVLLAVNMLQDGGNFSQISPNIGSWATLAGHLPNGTIVRLGWEFDIGTGTGGFGNVMTQANYVTGWQQIHGAMVAVNPTLKFDFCCNAGTSTLTQLESWYPGDAYVDYVGFDHYDNPGGGGDFSNCGAAVNLAALRGKPVSCGEWGLTTSAPGKDDPAFINDGAQVFLDPTAAAARYGWPAYTVIYQSYFNNASFHTDLTNFPNSKAAYTADFS